MPLVANLLYMVWVGVVFLTMISILVAAHELGHYLFARLFGMGVEEFAIGFGKRPLVTWMRRYYTVRMLPGQYADVAEGRTTDAAGMSAMLEGTSTPGRIVAEDGPDGVVLKERTDFTIRPFPLGGFVRIKGMLPDEEAGEVMVAGGFYSKPPWQRFLVLLAGPLFSILAGVALLIGIYMVDGSERLSNKPIIGALTPGDPAALAGIKEGDRILAIGSTEINTFYDMVRTVRSQPDQPLSFLIDRKGARISTTVTPKMGKEESPVFGPGMELTDDFERQAKIGASPGFEQPKLGLADASVEAVKMPVKAVTGLLHVFAKPKNFKQNVGGPGTMVKATSNAVRMGIAKVIELAALLSISVGVFNLLPSPPLDGGQMAIAIAEMFRGGRRLSFRVQTTVGTIGLVFVLLLFSSAIFVDVQRFTERPPQSAGKAK